MADLDEQIAEKVFGLVKYQAAAGPNVCTLGWGPPDGTGRSYLFDLRPLKPYSTDITAAFEVWEWLRKSNQWCCLKISSDYHYSYDIELIHAQYRPGGEHLPVIVETGEDLPELICRVALKAVEFMKEKKA